METGRDKLSLCPLEAAQPVDQLEFDEFRSRFSKADLLELEAWPQGVSGTSAQPESPDPSSAEFQELQELLQEDTYPNSPSAVASRLNDAQLPARTVQHNLRWSVRQRGQTSDPRESEDEDEEGSHEERRRPGRPVIYRGDPDAKELTEQQRRQIKRRIANRESARRMREKKHENQQYLRGEIRSLQARAADLNRQLQDADRKNAALRHHLRALHGKWVDTEADRAHLQDENASLKAMQVAFIQAATCPGCSEPSRQNLMHEFSLNQAPAVGHQLLMQPW